MEEEEDEEEEVDVFEEDEEDEEDDVFEFEDDEDDEVANDCVAPGKDCVAPGEDDFFSIGNAEEKGKENEDDDVDRKNVIFLLLSSFSS